MEALCNLTRQEGLSEFSAISGYSDFSEGQASRWIQKELDRFRAHRLGKFAVVLKESGYPIGISGLFQSYAPHEADVELNYRYPKVYRGKGFATEAAQAILQYGFDELGLKKIFANADLRNVDSRAVLHRLGMKQIGEVSYGGIQAGRWVLECK